MVQKGVSDVGDLTILKFTASPVSRGGGCSLMMRAEAGQLCHSGTAGK